MVKLQFEPFVENNTMPIAHRPRAFVYQCTVPLKLVEFKVPFKEEQIIIHHTLNALTVWTDQMYRVHVLEKKE